MNYCQKVLTKKYYEEIKDCALREEYPRRKDGSYIVLCEGFRTIAVGMQLMKEFGRPFLAAML